MSHPVTCIYCKQKFDRDVEPYIQISARKFAHQTCTWEQGNAEEKKLAEKYHNEVEQEKRDYENFQNYLKVLNQTETLPPRFYIQINQWKKERNYTYSGMYRAMRYFLEVKRGNWNGSIGIIPYVYDKAQEYYRYSWEQKQLNEDAAQPIEQIKEETPTIVTILPPKPKERTRRKLFTNIEEDIY